MSASDTNPETTELTSLLRAKLHRPRAPRHMLVRPRLLEKLNRGLDGRLTLVSAPAGFGKTTLISSWLEGMAAAAAQGAAPPAAWLSLDEHDSDLVVFLRYLVAALRTCFPDACSETALLLRAPQPVPESHLSEMLSNEIEELPNGFILVLDDYYRLTGRAVHVFLADLMGHWPRPLHLVLISRFDPPLPLTRLRAQGKMNDVGIQDLRLNAQESAAYLDQELQTVLSEQERAWLEQHAEGWIAGLRLATLALRHPSQVKVIPSNLFGARKSIYDYMQEEVLAQQAPPIQTFLLKTSVLERFCLPLCAAILGEGDPAWSIRASMDWVERAGLFVVNLDDHGMWYRYHALFRDFLRETLLERFGAEVVADLNRRASDWFAQQDIVHEAMSHALGAGDIDLAARLIDRWLCDVLNREDRATLEHWLDLLPEEFIQRQPWLLVTRAWALQPTWQLGQQAKVVAQAEARLEQNGGAGLSADSLQLLRAQILILRGQYAYLSNQPARCTANCEEALALLPPSWEYVRGGAIVYWGLAMAAAGQDPAAEHILLAEYESLDDKATSYGIRILQALCFNQLNAGRLEPARQNAHVMLQQAIRARLPTPENWAHLCLGLVHYQWNELDAAGLHFAEVIERRYLAQALAAYHGLAGLAWVRQIRGESAEALRLAELLSAFQLEQRGYEGDEARSVRARLMLEQGDREGAFRWADAFTTPVPDRPLFWFEVPHITRAYILLARNRADDVRLALQILDELLDIAERTHNTRTKITILALRALALDAQGQSEGAWFALQEAVDLSQPGGFLRTFVDLGPPMKGLLGRLAAQGAAAEPIRRILAAFPRSGVGTVSDDTAASRMHAGRSATGFPTLMEPLTARELQILALLREPMSPQEIAQKVGISYLTVKRHSINLYGKLGVNARWDAVNRAIELGILPQR